MYPKNNPPIKTDWKEKTPHPLTVLVPDWGHHNDLRVIFNASEALFKSDMIVLEIDVKIPKEWVGKKKVIRAVVVRDELGMAIINGYKKSTEQIDEI